MKPFSELADDILQALFKAVEARDAYTKAHMSRTSALAIEVAVRLGLSSAELDAVSVGASLHDCGKIGIPDAILNKSGRLTAGEFEVMKRHPVIGQQICEPMHPATMGLSHPRVAATDAYSRPHRPPYASPPSPSGSVVVRASRTRSSRRGLPSTWTAAA